MKKLLVLCAVLLFASETQAAPVFVAGPDPVSPFTGTVIDFEALAEATIVSAQFAGVTFTQTGGGAPMIDNADFLFAYESNSGTGVLTGSAQGGNVATTAGIIATFDAPQSEVGAFLSDTAPLGNYVIQAFGAGNVLLESFVVTAAMLPQFTPLVTPGCDNSSPFNGQGCGVFVGFNRPQGDILSIQFGPSAVGGADAFAIDDFTYGSAAAVPEPTTLVLLGSGIATLVARKRRNARKQQLL